MSTLLSRLFYIFVVINLFVREALNTVKILEKGVASLERNSAGLQFYFDIENEDKKRACTVSTSVKKCCLTDSPEEDCITMFVCPETEVNIAPQERLVLISVYPTVYPHDLVGYCNFDLKFSCARRKKSIPLKIHFDTRLEKLKKARSQMNYITDPKLNPCESLDEDPFDDCEPVDCNMKYLDGRCYFNEPTLKCVAAPYCVYEPSTNNPLPYIAYHPESNTCRDLENSFSSADVFLLTTGSGIVKKSVKPIKELEVIIKSNCSTISQKLRLIRDMMTGNLYPMFFTTSNFSEPVDVLCEAYLKNISSIVLNVIVVSTIVISTVFCCVIAAMFYRILSCKSFVLVMEDFRMKVRSSYAKQKKKKKRVASANEKIKTSLIREIMNRDIPIELRHSAVDLCGRAEMQVKEKAHYQSKEAGSQIVVEDEEELVKHEFSDESI